MTGPALLVIAAAAFVASALLTGAVRRYALARAMLDRPNERSSHRVPTPRGGGLAIALVTLGGALIAGLVGALAPRTAAALVGGGAAVAIVGWIDDARGVSAGVRAAVHAAAAAWAVACVGGLPTLAAGPATLQLGWAGSILAVVGIVWAVNFYNFMDGIDGIAGGEAVVVGVAGALLSLARGQGGLAAVSLAVAGAAAGFLVWNWPPARIFMGDVGSGLLGYLFAVVALASEAAGGAPLLLWLLVLGVFFFDATVTLVRRVARGERWYAAHATHAYQRAVQHGRTHAAVSSTVLALTAGLAAVALLALDRPALVLPALGGGFAALALVYAAVERARPMPPGGARAATDQP